MPNESEHIPDALPGLRMSSSREIARSCLNFFHIYFYVFVLLVSFWSYFPILFVI